MLLKKLGYWRNCLKLISQNIKEPLLINGKKALYYNYPIFCNENNEENSALEIFKMSNKYIIAIAYTELNSISPNITIYLKNNILIGDDRNIIAYYILNIKEFKEKLKQFLSLFLSKQIILKKTSEKNYAFESLFIECFSNSLIQIQLLEKLNNNLNSIYKEDNNLYTQYLNIEKTLNNEIELLKEKQNKLYQDLDILKLEELLKEKKLIYAKAFFNEKIKIKELVKSRSYAYEALNKYYTNIYNLLIKEKNKYPFVIQKDSLYENIKTKINEILKLEKKIKNDEFVIKNIYCKSSKGKE